MASGNRFGDQLAAAPRLWGDSAPCGGDDMSARSAAVTTSAAEPVRQAGAAGSFEDLLLPGVLVPAFQPIMDLLTGSVVGYEALARWPGLPAATPDRVFREAHRIGRVADLDWACRLAALRTAMDSGMPADRTLFVNVEPASVGRPAPEHAACVLTAAQGRLRIMLELTERALFTHPAELMRTVGAARDRGWGIALDDVGANPASLAMLPFVSPDVIKLDLSLIQASPSSTQARIMAAVMAHAERTDASVLAEGVESEAHLERALSLGAVLGQGWYFGRPGPIDDLPPAPTQIPFAQGYDAAPTTPFDLVARHRSLRVGRKRLLLALSRFIEDQALNVGTPPVVLTAFQTAARFTPGTRRRYQQIAARCPFVGVLGADLPATPLPGVRGADLAAHDPLVGEWTVVVVGDHYAGALIARDLGDDGPDHDRRFEFVVTHDRRVVLAAGRSLMSRLLPRARP